MNSDVQMRLLRIAEISFKEMKQQATLAEIAERDKVLGELGMTLPQALQEAEQVVLEKK
jgi:hypothetical protein